MGDRNDAVDVRKLIEQAGFFRRFGDKLRHRAGAVHRGENAQIIARAVAAVGAPVAHESSVLVNRSEFGVLAGKAVVAAVLAHAEIVNMNMLAGRDRGFGLADDLTVADDVFAFGDVAGGDLVTAGNHLGEGNGHTFDDRSGSQIGKRDHDIIVAMQTDGVARCLHLVYSR